MNIKTFWTNSIWYILLLIISIALLVYVFIKAKEKKRVLGFFLALFGLALFIETIIYIFLKAYEYYPGIIPNSAKNDGVLGNICSQLSVSIAALFISVFNIRFRGVVLIGAIYFGIEWLFLALGIYQIFWYRPWITLILLTSSFEIAKRWYRTVMGRHNRVLCSVTAILGIFALYLPTTNWFGILSGFYDIKEDILIDPYISHAVVAIPKYTTQILMFYFLNKCKANWVWYAVVVGVVLSADVLLNYTGLLFVKDGLVLVYSAITIITTYLYILLMEKLLYAD